MPTPRRPGDPGRAPPVAAILAAALAMTTLLTASPASAAPASPAPTQTATANATNSAATTSATPPSATTTSATPPSTATTAATPTAATPSAGDAADTANPGPTAAAADAPASSPRASARVPARKPPRVDGPYIGGTLAAGGSFARVNNFPTPDPLSGGTASLRFGQAIYPWMTIGLEVTGTWANRFADPRQRMLQGAALVDFGFLPVPRIPLSLHVGFGAGGGAVRQADRTARSGFGGAVFSGAVRYEIFPLAARKRPTRGGGFSLGPELGWLGFTPAAKGRPMTNTVYIGLFMGFYFGS